MRNELINWCHRYFQSHLMGDTTALRPWLKDGVYNRLAAEIRARKVISPI
jgi:hypothetical protein